MSNMTTVEAKAFVPAKDFALSKQFYQDLGLIRDFVVVDPAYVLWRIGQSINRKTG